MTAQAIPECDLAFGMFEWQRDYALKTFDAYVSEVESRVFPAFGDVSKTETAFHGEEVEASDSASAAQSKQADIDLWYEEDEHRKDLAFAKDRITEMAIAGLYHLWERRVVHMLRVYEMKKAKLNDPEAEVESVNLNDFGKIRDHFKSSGWDLEVQDFYKKLNQLRLVTNAVKHGPGASMNKLWHKYPNLFWPYNQASYLLPEDLPTEPADANTLDLTTEHFREYAGAVEAFWKAVPTINPD
mgnify:CR=1 FL=1